MMMLSVSVWDLQAKSVEINRLDLFFWSHYAILMGLTVYLLLTDLTYSLYLYLYRKALSYS
jgi:hypothetical protein